MNLAGPHAGIGPSLGRFALATAVVTSCVACDVGGTDPFGPWYTIEVVSGNGQGGAPGWALPDPIVIQVLDRMGSAASGRPVVFSIQAGGGSVTTRTERTAADGTASTRWVIGASGLGTQSLGVWAEGAETVAVDASVLDDQSTDLVAVHGSLGRLKNALLFELGSPPVVVSWIAHPDTLLRLPPGGGPDRKLMIVSYDNRPLLVSSPFREAIDTVHVDLEPPVPVDISFVIYDGQFSTRVAALEAQLVTTQSIWNRAGMGVTMGQVTYTDSTELEPIEVTNSEACFDDRQPRPDDHVEVLVVTTIDAGRYGGFSCGSRILLGRVFSALPHIFAHEIGHSFSLTHAGTGIMSAEWAGDEHHDGEITWAHFNRGSVLNSIFMARPPDQIIFDCFAYPEACFPPLFDVGP